MTTGQIQLFTCVLSMRNETPGRGGTKSPKTLRLKYFRLSAIL